jgi:hypothetical protein
MSETTDRPQSVTNEAKGRAHVDQQVGYIDTYIKKVVHHHHTYQGTYQETSESPEKTFEAACEYLAGGAASKAAELIESALARGLRSAKVAYYWELALLAGRPFDHLSTVDLQKLDRAQELARGSEPDEWTPAALVIEELLACFSNQVRQGQDAEDDIYRYDAAFERYEALSESRRTEMGRHLSLLFSGGLQNRLDEERRQQIAQHRMGGDRLHRVPTFFEPDPAEPRRRTPTPPHVGPRHWIATVAGALAVVAGLVLLFRRSWSSAPVATTLLGLVLAAGCLGLVAVAPRLLDRRVLHARREEHVWFDVAVGPDQVEVQPTMLHELIRARIHEVVPGDLDDDGEARFWDAVGPELALLSDALHTEYPSTGDDAVAPQELDWLIRWHVRRLVWLWDSGDLGPPESAWTSTPRREQVLLATSTGMVVAACGLMLVTIARWSLPALGVVLGGPALLALGAACLVFGSATGTERRRYRQEVSESRQLLAAERSAWEAEVARLANRPSDLEMAEWLDYDKDHIRLSAMKDWGLRNGNVIAHVVLTEPHPESASGRVAGGPRRYERYIVRLFLLTDNGVRTLDVHVDFATGAENKQQRRAFRYDAIASARIEEPTVRRHGRRQAATPDGGGPRNGNRTIRRQALHLTLVNGEEFDINADYEQLLADEDRRDNEKLLLLEMETSGAVSTLRTLEAVAGEGREWISREQERKRRTASTYQNIDEPPEPSP